MRKEKSIKKAFRRVLSVMLAMVVVVTSMPYLAIQASALTPANPDNTTQTGYKNVLMFQKDKWNNLLQEVFGDTISKINVSDTATDIVQNNIIIPSQSEIANNQKGIVQANNSYFNWKTDLSATPWDGTEATVETIREQVTYAGDSVVGGNGTTSTAPSATVTYTVYNVENASQLRYAMQQAYAKQKTHNTKINITADIDLNGASHLWVPHNFNTNYRWLYIEGNGHTIYNMKCYSTQISSGYGNGGFVGNIAGDSKFIMKNLNFSNCLSFSHGHAATAVAVGYIGCRSYLENVNVYDSFIYSNEGNTGTLIGRTQLSSGAVFIRNCSSKGCYVFGTSHTGGLTGCQHNTGQYAVKYDAAFPSSPEAWIDYGSIVYPEMVENCYSVDCELYSLNSAGDSGGLLSCGGKLICRNSFTNNVVYGNTKTGAFLGRIVTPESGRAGLYDDNKTRRVEIYFEDCYASGSIEGQSKIGGFVGFDAGGSSAYYGVSVYKNCYTTAMVGMDYAGSQLGGFIGHENTSYGQKSTVNIGTDENGNTLTNTKRGSVYINCYAAGEVGNILTDTSTTQTGTYKKLGGFLGETGHYGNSGTGSYTSGVSNGTYVNCYYDMQTTAMRERACGRSDQYSVLGIEASQISGVTGVYTQHSEKKGIQGLTDTVDMGDSTAWKRVTDTYPMLNCFADEVQSSNNFGNLVTVNDNKCTIITQDENGDEIQEEKVIYDNDTINRIQSQLNEKVDLVQKYSLASASTVLLSHWDSTMNMNTGTIGDETSWVLGVQANKLTQVAYAEDDENKWNKDDDGKYWEKDYKNLTAGTYEFKVQEGESWAFNFGKEKFNGSNCSLTVPKDCDVKLKFDYTGKVSDTTENTNFRIWAELYNSDGSVYDVQELGANANEVTQNIWTVAGSFDNIDSNASWNPAYSNFDMNYAGDSSYVMSTTVPAGSYQFKITKDHDWATSYGLDGTDGGTNNNMEFTVSQECEVKFTFDEETHITTVTANPTSALTYVKTEKSAIDFTGFSLIAPMAITGHEWLDEETAVTDGEMTDSDEDGKYEVEFTVSKYDSNGNNNFDKIYGYKVIENAVDAGPNSYFRLSAPTDDSVNQITLKFTYDSTTQETNVACVEDSTLIENNPQVDNYGVLGSKTLTGLNWGKDDSDVEVENAGKMSVDEDNIVWSKTYTDVPAGTHSFKVVANCSFSSGIDYGAYDGSGNYEFTTTEESDITIKFNSSDKRITVTTEPDEAIVKERYVVSGNTNLTGENWKTDSEANEMTLDERTGTYIKTYENLTSNPDKNYVFKVVKFGQDNKSGNLSFRIIGESEETYQLKITYYPKTKKTEYRLYDSSGAEVSDYLKALDIEFYSVIGDEGLTGYNWMGENNVDQEAAALKGKMTADENGILSVTFKDVEVSETANSFGFKVVANGTWDSGIDYGNGSGGNYSITLSSTEVNKCDVTITFDPTTHQINVTTNPDCIAVIDESKFEWFIAGDYRLVSSDEAYKAPAEVYDTVRDITYKFNFTSGSNLNWKNDDSENSRNAESNFYSRLGTDENQGFSLDYTVEGKSVSGTFNEPVVQLVTSEVTDQNGNILYLNYGCDRFMPGKQWLTVTYGAENDTIKGTRNLRLVPTAYLEAGNDADINVLQAGSDLQQQNVRNVVTYRDNSSEDVTYTGLKDGDNKTVFSYYNFALTAGYAITDRTGLGYYGNYSNQSVIKYDTDRLRKNVLDSTKSNDYYVMTSAFAQTADYSDVVPEGENTNLIVDELVDQSLIGSSYNDGENYAKTIVKIYKKVEDANGTLEPDGKRYSYPKVFMDSTENSTSEYHNNYLKWTGQKAFDADDEGTYFVTYFWSLSDGRFLTDSKKVYVRSGLSNIEKSVDKSYIEKNADADDKTIKYTVTYTNKIEGDFTIFDVLPFNNDTRYDSSKENSINNSTMNGSSFSLKSITVNSEILESDSANPVSIDSITDYYTLDDSVRSYITEVDDNNVVASDNAAVNVDITKDGWTEIQDGFQANDIVALAVKGTQKGSGTTKITVTYEVNVNNPEFKDYYINNAFFSVTDKAATEAGYSDYTVNGYSDPVTTAVVGRGLSGYVWLDSDLDGKIDNNEPPVQGVTATLMKKSGNTYVSTGLSKVTGDDGKYEFSDIYPSGDDYQVQFSVPGADSSTSGDVTIKYSSLTGDAQKSDETVNFDELNLTRRFSPYQVDNKIGSRNIAQQLGNSSENKRYSIDEVMPSAEEIFSNNNQRRFSGGSIQNYYFLRQFQNMGLTNVSENKTCSLTVKKVDSESGELLAGVKFKLEYRLSDESYTTVTYKLDSEGNYVFTEGNSAEDSEILEANEVVTDEKGEIKFTNLPSMAEYRLTEVQTLEGYNLLPSSLEFNLPYYIAGNNTDGYVTGNDEEPVNGTYYYDVTYTVTNSAIPNMPLTGVESNFTPIVIATVLFATGVAIYAIYIVKKRKSNIVFE